MLSLSVPRRQKIDRSRWLEQPNKLQETVVFPLIFIQRALPHSVRFDHSSILTLAFGLHRKLPKQLWLLTTEQRVHRFVTDNKILGSPAFDPLLLLLSEEAKTQLPNILVHASARHGQNPTTCYYAAGLRREMSGRTSSSSFRRCILTCDSSACRVCGKGDCYYLR